MSYIRCLSNPEGLYIFVSDYGINISHNLNPPFSSEPSRRDFITDIIVPEKVFFEGCHRWDHGPNVEGTVKVGGLLIQERQIYEKTGKKVQENRSIRSIYKDKAKRRMVIFFKYKAQFIMLWRVTWQYVVGNVLDRRSEDYKCRWCE